AALAQFRPQLLNQLINQRYQNYAGLTALGQNAAQQTAIGNINNSAEMQTYLQQGENAILQNASATGGLRGGNTQAALAQFRPQLLNQLINQRYQNYAGLTALGQNAA
ncbi:hypothetical protein, partial [Staphylococcus aureus]|uniref:hypothetical protein n=1 Tax=Staphylococcus aureus TaxID=1280 RepID=UPI001C838BCE